MSIRSLLHAPPLLILPSPTTLFHLSPSSDGYYGDYQLQGYIFNGLQVVGLYTWLYRMDKSNTMTVKGLGWRAWLFYLTLTALLIVAFYYEIPALAAYLDGFYFYETSPLPHRLDATNNALNVVAMILMLGGYWEQWLFWLAVDFICLAMFSGSNGYPPDFNLLFMYSLFTANAMWGLRKWWRMHQEAVQKLAGLQKEEDVNGEGQAGAAAAATGKAEAAPRQAAAAGAVAGAAPASTAASASTTAASTAASTAAATATVSVVV